MPSARHERLIREHLEEAKALYGEGWWIPKCHLALHLLRQLQAHGCLLSCFAHERKHKIVKKLTNFQNHVLDTSKTFKQSILDDVLYGHLQALTSAAYIPSDGVGLLEPVRAALRKLALEMQKVLGTEQVDGTAAQAIHGGRFPVSHNDVVVFCLDGRKAVGRVLKSLPALMNL